MAQDFAKLRAERPMSGRPTRGAAPRVSEPTSSSHWSWFFTGLFSGLFICFVAYLGFLKPTPAQLSAALEVGELAPAQPEVRRFGFYEYLPEAEVQVNVNQVGVLPAASVPPPEPNPPSQ